MFYARLPDPNTGACPLSPYGTVPANTPILVSWQAVYRLWNQRVDSNHRIDKRYAVFDGAAARPRRVRTVHFVSPST